MLITAALLIYPSNYILVLIARDEYEFPLLLLAAAMAAVRSAQARRAAHARTRGRAAPNDITAARPAPASSPLLPNRRFIH